MNYFNLYDGVKQIDSSKKFKKSEVETVFASICKNFPDAQYYLKQNKKSTQFYFEVSNSEGVFMDVNVEYAGIYANNIYFHIARGDYNTLAIQSINWIDTPEYEKTLDKSFKKVKKFLKDDETLRNTILNIENDCKNGIYHLPNVQDVIDCLKSQGVLVRDVKVYHGHYDITVNDLELSYHIVCENLGSIDVYKDMCKVFRNDIYMHINNSETFKFDDTFKTSFVQFIQNTVNADNDRLARMQALKHVYHIDDKNHINSRIYDAIQKKFSFYGEGRKASVGQFVYIFDTIMFFEHASVEGEVTDKHFKVNDIELNMDMNDEEFERIIQRHVGCGGCCI